jgi:hypothetical protein
MTPRLRRVLVLVREQIKLAFRNVEEREKAYELMDAFK